MTEANPESEIHRIAELIANARHIFVLAGAGMSTDSGIPDFRGPDGLWTKYPEAIKMFDLDYYQTDPAVRVAAWRVRQGGGIPEAQPNDGHRALAALETADRKLTIATQNIDGLQQRVSDQTDVLEVHGTFWETMCLSCDERLPIEQTFDRLDQGEFDPDCQACGGILKSATIAFGQALDVDVMTAAAEAALSCDLALAIGTSLSVQPAASFCDVAVADESPLVIVNAEPTDYDELASVVVHAQIGPTLTRVNEILSAG